MRWFPPPLLCAVLLGTAIAVLGAPHPVAPEGTTPDDNRDDRITGTVGGPLLRTAHGIGAPLETGDATVWVWSERTLEPGQRVEVIGRLRTPREPIDPGMPLPSPAAFELTAKRINMLGEEPSMWRWAARMQREWSARVRGDDPASAALRGIVTGDRAGIPPALDQRWRAVGIYHVLSVSGLHLAVVAGLVFWLLRRALAASPWGGRIRPARWAAPLALAFAIAYTLVTGAQLATVRSLVVVAIVLAGQMFDRPVRLVDALGVAAIVILLWRPHDLFDPSFQLSFVAALTLAMRPRKGRGALRWIGNAIATSAWVTITTAPITAYHFQQVTPGGVVGNVVLTPIAELLALPLGLAGIVLGDLGAPFVAAAVWLVARVDSLAALLAHAVPIGGIAVASAPVMLALVGISLWGAARPQRIAWLALCATWALAREPSPAGSLRVTFLDVGQGDAALVELPDGRVWLVDAGGNAGARDAAAATAPGRIVARALAAYGHAAIDRAILSHPHPDHYLGFAALADAVPIRELWFADAQPPLVALASQLAVRGTRLVTPSLGALQSDDVELVALAPRYQPVADGPVALAPDPVRSVNDNSLVIAIRFAHRTVLFAGDLEHEGEEQLVTAGVGRVDVVKVAHHGSRTSSSPAFVAATRPQVAVISCGVGNAFGFPAPEVVERWRAAGALVERTDRDGAVVVTIDRDGGIAVDRLAR